MTVERLTAKEWLAMEASDRPSRVRPVGEEWRALPKTEQSRILDLERKQRAREREEFCRREKAKLYNAVMRPESKRSLPIIGLEIKKLTNGLAMMGDASAAGRRADAEKAIKMLRDYIRVHDEFYVF